MPLLNALCRKFNLERATCVMSIGFLAACVLPIVIVRLTGQYSPILAMALNAVFHGDRMNGHDSWAPIGNAMRYLAGHTADGLYQATYYHSQDQFIYSPLSLVFCRLTQWPPLLDWTSPTSLNRFFRWVLFANVALTIVLFNDFYRLLDIARVTGFAEKMARILLPLGASLLFFPLLRGYWLGNIQTGLTFLVVLSLFLWLRGHRIRVGICLGLVCIFKPALAPLLLWALLRREYRVIAGFLGVVLVFGAASVWMYGIGVHKDYLTLMSYLSLRGESFVDSHSVNSLLNRAVFNGPNLIWDGSHNQIRYIPWIHYATVITSLGFIGLALIGRRQEAAVASWLDYAFALLCISLASPVVYEHHMAFTLVLFMMAGAMLGRNALAPLRLLWALGISYFLVTNYLELTDRLADTPFNFLQSYRLFGALILLAVLYRLRAGDRGPAATASTAD